MGGYEMEKAPHTPGPWLAESVTFGHGFTGSTHQVIATTADKSDTRSIAFTGGENAKANATLVAAAPDFEAAAEIAIAELDAVEREIGVPSKALPLLRAAIAKARGES